MVVSSGSPLAAKLGVREGATLALLHAPSGFHLALPPDVSVKRQARGQADVVVAFFVRKVALEQQIDALSPMIFPSGGLWIAWPKRASGRTTDLTDNVVRQSVLQRGLVDNKVCAVDETWSALRFVWRLQQRPGRNARADTPYQARS
jgi:hypothetical protein